jgi:hypothetical protein
MFLEEFKKIENPTSKDQDMKFGLQSYLMQKLQIDGLKK